ncbi:hypothetical protein QJS66_20160 [Kocuria rhizophila]|nr:hypothetical protein QJS66_20160 [Kocuria rhizophila]
MTDHELENDDAQPAQLDTRPGTLRARSRRRACPSMSRPPSPRTGGVSRREGRPGGGPRRRGQPGRSGAARGGQGLRGAAEDQVDPVAELQGRTCAARRATGSSSTPAPVQTA